MCEAAWAKLGRSQRSSRRGRRRTTPRAEAAHQENGPAEVPAQHLVRQAHDLRVRGLVVQQMQRQTAHGADPGSPQELNPVEYKVGEPVGIGWEQA